ncbi:hypothetical protein [Saccharothrix variisporea]|uniref:Uncharacterized protein n=1 Tax=Saccharothrix variisporea TaxID=543527 RepID=A0A495WZT1_9PSEU|nr:hypothetical protein [Saccharothrix variisporea]RKT67157.1 hypothetical protein DFJ66_0325 [Saccharothrix variisporea]
MIDHPDHDRAVQASPPDADPHDPDAPATPSRFRRLTARIEDFQRRLAEHRTSLEADEQAR